MIWVNGEKFEFSQDVMVGAEGLMAAWMELMQLLDVCRLPSSSSPWSPSAFAGVKKADLVTKLVAFDTAWSEFEQNYIGQLILIEEKARRFVVEAVDEEKK